MIKMLTSYTYEIDDVDVAVAEILSQLNLAENQLKHSAGLLNCYAEFVDSGVVRALCDALPFDVVGATTLGIATAGEVGLMMLSLTVLTSDDIAFSSAVTRPLRDEQGDIIAEGYRQALSGHEGKPGMIITYTPLIEHVGGEVMVSDLDRISGGVPVFGTLACDHHPDYHESTVLHNGQSHKDCMSMLLLWGDVHPRFLMIAISEEKMQKQKAVITASDGNVLRGINGITVLEYLRTLGLASGNSVEVLNAIPFIVDYNDGSQPVARAIYMITDEGHAVCGADMPVDATLAIGTLESDDVLKTAARVVTDAAAQPDVSGMLMFSCLSRCYILAADATAELDRVDEVVNHDIPYHVSYSGGEICPVYTADGKTVNRFHNFTYVICLL